MHRQGLVWQHIWLCFADLADHLGEAEGNWCFKADVSSWEAECYEETAQAVMLLAADTNTCAASLLHPRFGGLFVGRSTSL